MTDGLAREISALEQELREMAARGEHAHMLTLLAWADRLAVLSRRSPQPESERIEQIQANWKGLKEAITAGPLAAPMLDPANPYHGSYVRCIDEALAGRSLPPEQEQGGMALHPQPEITAIFKGRASRPAQPDQEPE